MATPQAISAGIGLSTGAIVLIAGVSILGAVIYYSNKKKKEIIDIESLSTTEEKYENHKWIITNAIQKKDKEKLKRLQDNRNIMKHDDLAKLINDFLDKDDYKNEKLK